MRQLKTQAVTLGLLGAGMLIGLLLATPPAQARSKGKGGAAARLDSDHDGLSITLRPPMSSWENQAPTRSSRPSCNAAPS